MQTKPQDPYFNNKKKLLKPAKTIFEEISDLLKQQDDLSESHNSSNSSFSDFFNNTLEAFGEETSMVIVTERARAYSDYRSYDQNHSKTSLNQSVQLQYIQEVFAQYEENTCDNKKQSTSDSKIKDETRVSTECTTTESDTPNIDLIFSNHPIMLYNPYFQNDFNREQTYINEISPEQMEEDQRTTLMIRNIPCNYNRDMLVDELDQKFNLKYDYINFPYDFKTSTNSGYAFINLKSKQSLKEFYSQFNGKKWMYAPNHAKVDQQNKQLIIFSLVIFDMLVCNMVNKRRKPSSDWQNKIQRQISTIKKIISIRFST